MQSQRYDHTLLILVAAVFLFASPLTSWLASLALPWYAIFIPWALIVTLIAMNQYWQHRSEPLGDDTTNHNERNRNDH